MSSPDEGENMLFLYCIKSDKTFITLKQYTLRIVCIGACYVHTSNLRQRCPCEKSLRNSALSCLRLFIVIIEKDRLV